MAREWEQFTTEKEWEVYLKRLVKTNDEALYKAIVLIYNNQTEEEKQRRESVEDNNIGFTKWDAQEMSEMALAIKCGKGLTVGQVAKARNKMTKYWRQLMDNSLQRMEREKREREEKIAKERLEQFRIHNETLRCCSDEGKMCEYGICDECVLTCGIQMKLDLQQEEVRNEEKEKE